MSTPEKESDDSIAVGLKQSLESAVRGLNAFLESLNRSGMPDAADGYRRLQAVLIQQRLWARNNSRSELDPLFQSIADAASDIGAILSPYSVVMSQLKDLNRIDSVELDQSNGEAAEEIVQKDETEGCFIPQSSDCAKLIGLLLIRGSMSMKDLSKASRMKAELLRRRIKELIESGAVSRKGKGGGTTYRLSKEFIGSVLRKVETQERTA